MRLGPLGGEGEGGPVFLRWVGGPRGLMDLPFTSGLQILISSTLPIPRGAAPVFWLRIVPLDACETTLAWLAVRQT